MAVCASCEWDDLRFEATAVNPPGQASDPDWDTTKGGWLFSGSGTETLFVMVQLPHTWAQGTELRPHFHWERTTSASGTVLWQMRYQWSVHTEAREDEVTINSSTPVTNSDVADTQMITVMPAIDATGKLISSMLIVQIERLGGSDTYAADARLLEFDIHYQMNSGGSASEYSKPVG